MLRENKFSDAFIDIVLAVACSILFLCTQSPELMLLERAMYMKVKEATLKGRR
jgi:hypothetical protein